MNHARRLKFFRSCAALLVAFPPAPSFAQAVAEAVRPAGACAAAAVVLAPGIANLSLPGSALSPAPLGAASPRTSWMPVRSSPRAAAAARPAFVRALPFKAFKGKTLAARLAQEAPGLKAGPVSRPFQALGRLYDNQSLSQAGSEAPVRSSLLRSARVGLVGAAASMGLESAINRIPAVFGYEFTSNYGVGPAVMPTVGEALRGGFGTVFVTPMAEEVIFRGLLMGGLAWLGSLAARRLGEDSRAGKILGFWLPALVSSIAFVCVHETGDPVLFLSRLVVAMVQAWVFHKEGLHASMAMHMANNLVPMAGMTGVVLFGPYGSLLSTLAMASVLGLAVKSYLQLQDQREDLKAGRVVPYPLTPAGAWVLAALIAGCALFSSLTPFLLAVRLAAAGLLAAYALARSVAARR
jgi:membrane protease YdiL (CAAX protease family)